MKKSIFMAALLSAAAASPAHATTTFCLGGGCSAQPDANVLVDKDATGFAVAGTLNKAPGTVTFTSTEELINLANGQARVAAVDGSLNNPLTITFSGGLISALEFDINALTNGDVTFSLTGGDSDGQVSGPFSIDKNGSNFFNAFNGTFSGLTMSFGNGATVEDVRQWRLTAPGITTPVPEPATWGMMILGVGMIGSVLRRRQRQRLAYRFG